MWKTILASIIVCICSVELQAKEDNDIFVCKTDTVQKSIYFRGIQQEAEAIDKEFCLALLFRDKKRYTDILPREKISSFGRLVNLNAGEKLNRLNLPNIEKQLDDFEKVLRNIGQDPVLPGFYIGNTAQGARDRKKSYYFTHNIKLQGILTEKKDKECESVPEFSVRCSVVLADLKEAINPYRRNATALTASETKAILIETSRQWDAYFDEARSQTFADIALTSWFESRHFKRGYLVGPPDRQWFLLHPNIVLEYVDAAPDGENMNLAVTVEWVGVNWWRNSIIGIPFGISLTSLYSDRPEVQDVGHGLTLYFDNKYSVGVVNHYGEVGVFMSLDILKLFEDKNKQADRFRNHIKNMMN